MFHLQSTGLPSLCISELKPWPPPTGMRNELLQVDRTSVYRSYVLLAQNTINQTAMFVWRQEWCGFQNNCYYLEQILIWCLLLFTAKGRCWKVAGSWQCKTSNQEQVLAEVNMSYLGASVHRKKDLSKLGQGFIWISYLGLSGVKCV